MFQVMQILRRLLSSTLSCATISDISTEQQLTKGRKNLLHMQNASCQRNNHAAQKHSHSGSYLLIFVSIRFTPNMSCKHHKTATLFAKGDLLCFLEQVKINLWPIQNMFVTLFCTKSFLEILSWSVLPSLSCFIVSCHFKSK